MQETQSSNLVYSRKEKKMRSRQLIFLLLAIVSLPFHADARSREEIKSMPELESIEEMLQFAAKQQNKPYRHGAEGPNAFDCSGFTRFCYKRLGITLNRSSIDQPKQGKKIRFRRHLKEGDLVFFRGSKGRKVGHVGIVYRKREGKKFDFIHASSSKGIMIEDSETKYFKKRYKKARRITSDRDIRKARKHFMKELKEAKEKAEERNEQVEQQASKVSPKKEEPKKVKASQQTHTVAKGDTLYNISKRYGCSVEDLKRWNHLKDNSISLGQELIIK